MTLWFILILMTGATAASLLWPLMQASAFDTVASQNASCRRWQRVALLLISALLPLLAVLLYARLGSP